MLIVGTDRMRIVGGKAAPDGARHAVDLSGRVLCRSSRARFAWPALTWEAQQGEEATCSLCVQVRNAQEALSQVPAYPAYPVGPTVPASMASGAPTAAPTGAIVPWQPSVGLFEVDQA